MELGDSGAVQGVSLGLGGVEDRPILVETSGLAGAEASNEMVAAVADHAAGCATPMEDMTASAAYRRALAATLAASVLERAIAAARAETTP